MDSPQVINCTVSTVSGVESSSVMISWMGPGGVITSSSRVTISPITSSGNNFTSSLQFTYLMEGDEGIYTCNVMILETRVLQLVELQSLISKFYLRILTQFGIHYRSLYNYDAFIPLLLYLTRDCTYICIIVIIIHMHDSSVYKTTLYSNTLLKAPLM